MGEVPFTMMFRQESTDRPETGACYAARHPVDDWPGIFIRGDEAKGYVQYLERVILMAGHNVRCGTDELSLSGCQTLLDLLKSCEVSR